MDVDDQLLALLVLLLEFNPGPLENVIDFLYLLLGFVEFLKPVD